MKLISLLAVFVLLSASFVVGDASASLPHKDANVRKNTEPVSADTETDAPPAVVRNRGESLYELRNTNSHLDDEESTHNFSIETLEGVAIAGLIIAILACCFICIFGGWWAWNRNRMSTAEMGVNARYAGAPPQPHMHRPQPPGEFFSSKAF